MPGTTLRTPAARARTFVARTRLTCGNDQPFGGLPGVDGNVRSSREPVPRTALATYRGRMTTSNPYEPTSSTPEPTRPDAPAAPTTGQTAAGGTSSASNTQVSASAPAASPAYAPSAPSPSMGSASEAPAGGSGGTTMKKNSSGSLMAIFDLTFRKYVTPSVARIVYILVAIAAVLGWLGFALLCFMFGALINSAAGEGGGLFMFLGVVVLLGGWIPALLQLIFTRMVMEFVISSIQTAEEAGAIRDLLEKQHANA